MSVRTRNIIGFTAHAANTPFLAYGVATGSRPALYVALAVALASTAWFLLTYRTIRRSRQETTR